MYRQHPTTEQNSEWLTVEPKRFITEECLNRQQWSEYTKNYCPWHVQKKIDKKYWPKSNNQLGKGETHRTKKNQ